MKRIIIPITIIFIASFFSRCGNQDNNKGQQQDEGQTVVNKTGSSPKKNVKFTVKTENVVEAGEIFQIKFELNAEGDSFDPPDFKGIDVVSGPMTSSYSSMQIINGKSSNSVTNSYTYNISCSEPGTYKIKPAEVTVDGDTYKTDTVSIKVIGEQKTASSGVKTKNVSQQKINTKEDVFIRTDFSKTSVYNGEHITLTTKVYTKSDFQNIREIKFPDYSGFWSKPLQEPRQLQFHNELINGKKYSVAMLKQILLFAVKPGKYTVSPYVISLQLKKKDGKARDFFGNIVDNYKLINKRLQTKKQTIIVKPLPEPVPENFSGFTGKDVTVKTDIDTHSFRTDESANLKVTVSGNGNLYMLSDLPLKLPEGLKHFKPETELKDKYTAYGETGDNIFNFIITSDSAGTYSIPSIDFTYFDTDLKNYKTIHTKPLELNVAGGKAYNPDTNEGNILSNKDIRFIKDQNIILRKKNTEFVGSLSFYLIYPVLLVLFTIFVFLRRRYLIQNADVTAVKKKKAGKVSQKRLKTALKFMNEHNDTAFYKEIMNAIWGYLSDKLSVSSDELTKDGIENLLKAKKTDETLINKLLNIIEICGYAQYSPAGDEAKPEKIYKDTGDVINELEDVL